MARDPLLRDGDHLAVFHLAYELGADDIEGTCLRGQHPGLAQSPEHERTDPDRITRADQHVVGQTGEGIGTLDLQQGIDQPFDDAAFLGAGNQMQNDLRIGGRLADGARGNKFLPQRQGVGQVAVVADGKAAGVEIDEQGLYVAQNDIAGGRVAVVPDGHPPAETRDDVGLAEVVANETKAPLLVEAAAVVGHDAAAFLSAVLQRVQPEGRDGRRVLMPEYAENAALLAEPVIAEA